MGTGHEIGSDELKVFGERKIWNGFVDWFRLCVERPCGVLECYGKEEDLRWEPPDAELAKSESRFWIFGSRGGVGVRKVGFQAMWISLGFNQMVKSDSTPSMMKTFGEQEGERLGLIGREHYLGISLLRSVYPFTQSYVLISWWYTVFMSIYFALLVIIFWDCFIDLYGSLDLFYTVNVNLVYCGFFLFAWCWF